jgi:hypothetical protein
LEQFLVQGDFALFERIFQFALVGGRSNSVIDRIPDLGDMDLAPHRPDISTQQYILKEMRGDIRFLPLALLIIHIQKRHLHIHLLDQRAREPRFNL